MKPLLDMLIPLVRMLLVIATLVFFIAPRSHAEETVDCFAMAQKVLAAQQLMIVDNRPLHIVRDKFLRISTGRPVEAQIAWGMAVARRYADHRFLSIDAQTQCENLGLGYMYQIYVDRFD